MIAGIAIAVACNYFGIPFDHAVWLVILAVVFS